MAENAPAPDDHFYRAVAGITLTIPSDRPDLLLVELKTPHGPLRFSMPQGIASQVAEFIEQKAKELKANALCPRPAEQTAVGREETMPVTNFEALADANAATAGRRDMIEPEFWEIYNQVRPYTMTSVERLYALWKTVNYVCEAKIQGSFVECGVWRGGSCMMAAMTFLKRNDERPIYLCDTFAGHGAAPIPDAEADTDIMGNNGYRDYCEQKARGTLDSWAAVSEDTVFQDFTRITNYPTKHIRLVKGRIEDAEMFAEGGISVLRIDTDWKSSVEAAMRKFYPQLTRGGVLILDDYGHYFGNRQAADEMLGNSILLNRIDYSGRVGVKL